MSVFRRLVLVFLVSCFVVFGGSVAYAERSEVDSVSFVGQNQATLLAICSSANRVAGVNVLTYTGNDGLLTFSNRLYSTLDINTRRDFMETALLGVKESGLGSQAKNKVYNFIAEQDGTTSAAVKYLRSDASADFAVASSWFKPFGSVFGVVMGFLSLFIFMFIGVSVMVDVSYMVLPAVRVIFDSGSSEKPKWVSSEASISVRESESSGGGSKGYKGYMGLYFKRRTPSLVVMALCLGYLISGKIYDIIVYLIDSFVWIFSL